MRIVNPQDIDAAQIVSTNVSNDFADWDAGSTPYSEGSTVVYNNEVYEALSSNSDDPETGAAAEPPTWTRLGWSNQYRMFREGRDSQTESTDTIDVTLTFTSKITTVGLLGLVGDNVQLIVTDDTEGVVYNETIDLYTPNATTWWEFFFLPYDLATTAVFEGIPPYPDAEYQIIVSGADASATVKVGRVICGIERDVGVTNYGTSVQLQDYSTKDRDGFGNLQLVTRRNIRIIDYDVTVDTNKVDLAIRTIENLISVPSLVIGETNFNSTITYGILQDVTQGIDGVSTSDLTVRVEEF